MAELNVSELINNPDGFAPMDFSASLAELGEGAGCSTWTNAVDFAVDCPLVVSFVAEHESELRDYFASYGAWDAEDMAMWSVDHLGGLVVQEVAASLREAFPVRYTDDVLKLTPDDWKQYEQRAESGQVSARLSVSDSGQVFAYFGT